MTRNNRNDKHNKKKNCLIVLAKNPVAGQVKTRLTPSLSLEEACNIYQGFVHQVLNLSLQVPVCQRVIAYAGKPQFLKDMAKRYFQFLPQGSGNLGIRLQRIFQWARKGGFSKTVVMGSDSPNLPKSYLLQAFDILNKKDLVLGPAWDGGYYLIGARDASSRSLFQGIQWSTSKALIQTISRAKGLNLSIGILPAWYDIDTYEDLRFLGLEYWLAKRKFN